jgi:microsomal epoxide hydrolase
MCSIRDRGIRAFGLAGWDARLVPAPLAELERLAGNVESVFPRDHILTNTTIYWVNNAIRTSMRTYANAARYPWQPSHDRKPAVEAPVGITFLGFENPPGVTTANRVEAFRKSSDAAWFNATYLNANDKGGHFAAYENPEAVIIDIRATFRPLRRTSPKT